MTTALTTPNPTSCLAMAEATALLIPTTLPGLLLTTARLPATAKAMRPNQPATAKAMRPNQPATVKTMRPNQPATVKTMRPQPVDDEPSGPQYPGVGTEAALANPDCDPDTGRIRIPVPNAPPCVVEWPEGADNGGATAPGVTADAIYIAVRLDAVQASTGVEGSVAQQEWRDTIEIFDGHYELYGRRLEPVFIESSGGGEVEQRADAIEAINNNDLFFAVNVTLGVGGTAEVYLTEMAAAGCHCVVMERTLEFHPGSCPLPVGGPARLPDLYCASCRIPQRPRGWQADTVGRRRSVQRDTATNRCAAQRPVGQGLFPRVGRSQGRN